MLTKLASACAVLGALLLLSNLAHAQSGLRGEVVNWNNGAVIVCAALPDLRMW